MGWKAIKAEPFDKFDSKITVEIRTLWFKPRQAEFVGGGTVWRQFPSGRRCATSTELWLCDQLHRLTWKDRPIAACEVAA